MIIYLYVKQHAVTNLLYFGVTTQNPFRYKGSGKYWNHHISKHGRHLVRTVEVWGFDDCNLLNDFATSFSAQNQIVESPAWANLKLETGNVQGEIGEKYGWTKEAKAKQSECRKGKTWEEIHGPETARRLKHDLISKHRTKAELRMESMSMEELDEIRARQEAYDYRKGSKALPGDKNGMYGKRHSEDSKKKMSISRKGKTVGIRNPMFGKTHTDEVKRDTSQRTKGTVAVVDQNGSCYRVPKEEFYNRNDLVAASSKIGKQMINTKRGASVPL